MWILVSSAHCLWHPAGDFSKAFALLLCSTNVTHCSSIQYCSQYRTAIMCLINLASPRSFPHSFDCFSLKTERKERKRQSYRLPNSFNLETSSNWYVHIVLKVKMLFNDWIPTSVVNSQSRHNIEYMHVFLNSNSVF